ncbi:MAG TPA: glutathione S-transferase family protein, partial [Quisquiliibacterium sp.]|nr:glutathione S-transferase family protein [Quisquiliibacterium sp.]
MITLYHCSSARSFRPLWTLEELGLPCELKMLPFPPRALAKEYLGINPLGTIPFMIDGDTRMSESAAICQYLVERHGPSPMAVTKDEPAFGAYLNFLHLGEATLTVPQTIVLRYTHLEPPERRLPQAVEDYRIVFHGRLKKLEPLLEREEFLCAGRFTAADVSVGYALLLAERLGLDEGFTPAVRAYWARLQQREGYRRAMDRQAQAAAEQGVAVTPHRRG